VFVDIDGMRIAYERVGAGPPLVLLHGFVGDGRATWGSQLDTLSEDFTVVAWDCPGAGASSDPPERFSMTNFADCFARFVATLGFSRVHVAGLSFGAALALAVYERQPSLPLTLSLVGGYAGWGGSLPPDVVQQRLQACLEASTLSPDRFTEVMLPTMFSPSAPAEQVEPFASTVAAFHPTGFRTMARALADADLGAVLSHVDVPTLLLHGDADSRAPLAIAEAMHAAIRRSKLVVLHGIGHVCSVEAPDRCTAELGTFLHEHAASPS
jgi:pimeloyl-ACP methyl ester carboxylesterase